MPIIIPKDIPAYDSLTKEKIFVMDSVRAGMQDIRPLEVAIVNLMPTKEVTETQLMRLLGNSPLQVNIHLINTDSYTPTHVSEAHMQKFYCGISEIESRKQKFDGMIVTGAPVETIPFEDVKYWSELCRIMDYAKDNVTSTIYICWGAQAALYHFYGIGKELLPEKMSGIYPTCAVWENDMLLKGLDDTFMVPHSRYTRVDEGAMHMCKEIKILAESAAAGISIAKTHDNKSFFFTGHVEYDRDTLKTEYLRDIAKGLPINLPENYFSQGGLEHIYAERRLRLDERETPERCVDAVKNASVNMSWKSTANLLFYNWLNYYVYQVTPYKL
jgi:homoserine O-succinyltransferase